MTDSTRPPPLILLHHAICDASPSPLPRLPLAQGILRPLVATLETADASSWRAVLSPRSDEVVGDESHTWGKKKPLTLHALTCLAEACLHAGELEAAAAAYGTLVGVLPI